MPASRLVFLTALLFCSCNRRGTPAATAAPAEVTVASTVPAVTDLIVGMGDRDRLVAVSSVVDRDRSDVGTLPKAGSYQSTDWEVLASVRPTILVTQMAADRRPPGFDQRLAAMHVTPFHTTIETLDDIFSTLTRLGAALRTPDRAATAAADLHRRLDAVARSVAGRPAVRTLLVVGPETGYLAGPGTFLDDLLKIAGGTNALPPGPHWPQVDRERLLSLKPDAILQLLSDPSPAQIAQAAAAWNDLSALPAVADHRVYVVRAADVLLPGIHVADRAEAFARLLHPGDQ